jgi:glyoxylase-like metal-dependent hydrolase (beta-lactamase superfamily II)
MAKVRAFEVGYCTHPACMAIKGAGLKSRCFPSRAYLLETRSGLYLWDTGYASHLLDAARGLYRLYPLVTPIHLEERHSLIGQLAREGIGRRDVVGIVVSHFHADHIAGLRDFPQARVICDALAWGSIQGLSGWRALRKAFLPPLIPRDMSARLTFAQELPKKALPSELGLFDTGWDLTGDGEIYLVPLPGHAAGHIGAFVQVDKGWILLASDAAWAPEGFIDLRGPAEVSFLIQDSRAAYYATLRKLQLLHRKGTADICLTHQLSDGTTA